MLANYQFIGEAEGTAFDRTNIVHSIIPTDKVVGVDTDAIQQSRLKDSAIQIQKERAHTIMASDRTPLKYEDILYEKNQYQYIRTFGISYNPVSGLYAVVFCRASTI